MKQHPSFSGGTFTLASPVNGHGPTPTNPSLKIPTTGEELIRFEEKRGVHIWVNSADILFVKTADHYVKSLVQHSNQKKWVIRHGTLKDLLAVLTHDHFVRLNKFYLLNLKHFLRSNENANGIYLLDDFFIAVPHRISPYVLGLLKKMAS